MSTSRTPEPVYQHWEYRPGSTYREMFIKGRRIRASVVEGTIHGPEPITPEEFAQDYQVPLEAVLGSGEDRTGSDPRESSPA